MRTPLKNVPTRKDVSGDFRGSHPQGSHSRRRKKSGRIASRNNAIIARMISKQKAKDK
jgi:hypothetical protein